MSKKIYCEKSDKTCFYDYLIKKSKCLDGILLDFVSHLGFMKLSNYRLNRIVPQVLVKYAEMLQVV